MKTKIFTFVFNRPDILGHQIKSIKKFFIGDFDINVVYDTRDNQYFDQFKEICVLSGTDYNINANGTSTNGTGTNGNLHSTIKH